MSWVSRPSPRATVVIVRARALRLGRRPARATTRLWRPDLTEPSAARSSSYGLQSVQSIVCGLELEGYEKHRPDSGSVSLKEPADPTATGIAGGNRRSGRLDSKASNSGAVSVRRGRRGVGRSSRRRPCPRSGEVSVLRQLSPLFTKAIRGIEDISCPAAGPAIVLVRPGSPTQLRSWCRRRARS